MKWKPAGRRIANREASVAALERREFAAIGGTGDDMAHMAAFQTVAQVFGIEQSRGWNHHRPQLECRQHGLP